MKTNEFRPQARTTPVKRRITIIGLHGGLEKLVTAKCGSVAHLRFLEAERSETALPTSDEVILMTRFLPHRWTLAVFGQMPRQHVHLHRGGIGGLVARIMALAGSTGLTT
jgi:hypothetical protein